jgi:transposase InsO family protein
MSRKANCWDNAVAESFFATLKREEATAPDAVDGKPHHFFATLKREEATAAYETKAHARQAIARYLHGFYNPTRMHSALGYLSPNDFARKRKQSA